jgi:CubicO group peptidase (beta-lactamase class C family)
MSIVPRSAVVVVAVLAAQAQTPAPTLDLHGAIGVIAARALERPVAGIAVAVARSGTVVEARGFGLADVDRKIAVTPQTVFHAASVSKNILAGVVLHLVEEGKLSLDNDITKYVAEAPTHGQHVTLRHLLTHTSGLFSYTSVPNAEANEALDLSHEQVLALIEDRPADFAPGASWRYSNTGSYLAGMAVERVTGMTYAAYLRSRVFEPLGMTSSSLCTVHDDVPALATGYDVQDGKFVPPPRGAWTVPFAGGGVCTTVSDLVRWQNALDAGRFVSSAHLYEMRRPTTLTDGTRIDYGLGTRLGSLQGHAVAGHTGSGLGFSTVLMTFPADRLTIAVLTNSASASAVTIAAAIARAAFELAPAKPAGGDVPDDERAALIGRFDSDEGMVESYACGKAMCFRVPGTTEGGTATRISPFVYAVGADTEVRFPHPPVPVEWGIVYAGGLFADAKRRVR